MYEKTLKLSAAARREKTQGMVALGTCLNESEITVVLGTSGEIVNLMAIDVERFKLMLPQSCLFWSSPFQARKLNSY